MASTLTLQATNPGTGGRKIVRGVGDRPLVVRVYKLAFGNPYVVGGEDISAAFNAFNTVLSVSVSQNEATIADRREFLVDHTGKKLIMFTAFNTESGAVDQTAVADVRLTFVGY